MRKILFALFLSLLVFIILNFLYCNLDPQTFNYPMQFQFTVPYLVNIRSVPIPLGFILITAFCLGIVFLALLQAIPALVKSIAVRSRDRKIRELEKELEEIRSSQASSDPGDVSEGP